LACNAMLCCKVRRIVLLQKICRRAFDGIVTAAQALGPGPGLGLGPKLMDAVTAFHVLKCT
jgi:hypothetical protein